MSSNGGAGGGQQTPLLGCLNISSVDRTLRATLCISAWVDGDVKRTYPLYSVAFNIALKSETKISFMYSQHPPIALRIFPHFLRVGGNGQVTDEGRTIRGGGEEGEGAEEGKEEREAREVEERDGRQGGERGEGGKGGDGKHGGV